MPFLEDHEKTLARHASPELQAADRAQEILARPSRDHRVQRLPNPEDMPHHATSYRAPPPRPYCHATEQQLTGPVETWPNRDHLVTVIAEDSPEFEQGLES
jgi:hypothetical protein